jgi:hypothetical protein
MSKEKEMPKGGGVNSKTPRRKFTVRELTSKEKEMLKGGGVNNETPRRKFTVREPTSKEKEMPKGGGVNSKTRSAMDQWVPKSFGSLQKDGKAHLAAILQILQKVRRPA